MLSFISLRLTCLLRHAVGAPTHEETHREAPFSLLISGALGCGTAFRSVGRLASNRELQSALSLRFLSFSPAHLIFINPPTLCCIQTLARTNPLLVPCGCCENDDQPLGSADDRRAEKKESEKEREHTLPAKPGSKGKRLKRHYKTLITIIKKNEKISFEILTC